MWQSSLRDVIRRCGGHFGGRTLKPSRRRGFSVGIPEQLEVRQVLDASAGTILVVPVLDTTTLFPPEPPPLIEIIIPPVGVPPLPGPPLLIIPVDSGNPLLPVPSINDYLNPVQPVLPPPTESDFPEIDFEFEASGIPGPIEIEYELIVPIIVIIF